MSKEHQIDVSHFDQPLAALAQEVETLHIRLDNFASGKTDRLVGQQTRYMIREALNGVDEALAELRERLEKAAPRLRGRVTAAMREELSRAIEFADQIASVNRRPSVALLTRELEIVLGQLQHDMSPSGLPEHDAPLRS